MASTKTDMFAAAQAALAANPALFGRIDEIMIRGDFGKAGTMGIIKGAHFKIDIKSTNPLGEKQTSSTGKLPAALVSTTTGTPIATLISAVVLAQQQTIDSQNTTLTSNATQIATLTKELAVANATIAVLQAQASGNAANIAAANAALATAQGS